MPTYRADVDGLRAVAVLAVVAYHAFPELVRGGFVGVDVFFVISGFLISGIIFEHLRDGTFSFSHFYARRIRRIFPSLAIVLAATLTAGWFLLVADRYMNLGKHAAAGAGFVANIVYWYESGYFDHAADTKPLLHLWSLGVEEQFYLVWPLLAVLAWKARQKPLIVILVILSASFAVNVWQIRNDLVGTFYSPLTRFWELMAGAVLAARPAGQSDEGARFVTRSRDMASAVGLLAIGGAAVWIDRSRSFPGLWALLPVGGTFLVIAAGQTAWLNRTVLSAPLLVTTGLISYPLYLWHWPLLSFARIVQGGTPSVAIRLLLMCVSLAFAALTFVAIEKPIRFGSWRRVAVPVCSIAMVTVAVLGWVVFQDHGVQSRTLNFTDQASFVQAVRSFREHGMRGAYRLQCDFSVQDPIDPSCLEAGARETWFLWGDSHAQALSHGITTLLPPGAALAQVATSSCPPLIAPFDGSSSGLCATANAFALASIAKLKPSVLILAQSSVHETTDWDALALHAHSLGAARVFLVGPLPIWKPNLPEVIVASYWDRPFDRVSEGLVVDRLESDRRLAARFSGSKALTYVPLMSRLCNPSGCIARVPGGAASDVIAWDDSHLTLAGSTYVAQFVLAPALRRP